MSPAQRQIEAAAAQTPEGLPQGPIVLDWEDYKELVRERDEAQAAARGYREQWNDLRKENAVTTEHLRVAQGRIALYVEERDEARVAARQILTARPLYDPIGWRKRWPWLTEHEP